MRQLRAVKGMLVGDRWVPATEVFEIDDDHRARQLVDLKHAEFVSMIAIPVGPPRRITARANAEKAVV